MLCSLEDMGFDRGLHGLSPWFLISLESVFFHMLPDPRFLSQPLSKMRSVFSLQVLQFIIF